MKTIKINEAQFSRLFEADGDSAILDGSDSISYPNNNAVSSVNAQVITDRDGEEVVQGETPYAEPTTTNNYAKQQSLQNWMTSGRGELMKM